MYHKNSDEFCHAGLDQDVARQLTLALLTAGSLAQWNAKQGREICSATMTGVSPYTDPLF